jgi:D-threonine aldolase
VKIADLATPALVIDDPALERNLSTMATAHPGRQLRPHVKAHKCTALAARQVAHGHAGLTCATPRELAGVVAAGVSSEVLLANETLDPERLKTMAALQDRAEIIVAVDSAETIAAAVAAGLHKVVIDVNIGLPRCGCTPDDAGRLADSARSAGVQVVGVMGYEGHLMMVNDRAEQRRRVDEAVDVLLRAHADVGGDIVSGGGTGTFNHHRRLTEVQAGSYALMDSHYAQLGLPFEQACWVVGTVLAVTDRYAVADAGLKAFGMDHGNPTVVADDGSVGTTWFVSDEHITFGGVPCTVGDRVRIVPAHIDPTMAMHDTAWIIDGDDVVDRWNIDLRGW